MDKSGGKSETSAKGDDEKGGKQERRQTQSEKPDSSKDKKQTQKDTSGSKSDKAADSDKSDALKKPENKAEKQSEPSSKRDDTTDKSDKSDGSSKAQDSARSEPSGDREKAEKVRSVDLSGDKKDRVKTSFRSENVKKITNVNIDISVGRRLPRDWDYHPVPSAVIVIVPEYRGYRYAYIEDRYVIVDPDTYEVVYVLEADGGSSVGRSTGELGSARCSADLTFSEEDRTFIIEKVRHSHSVKIGDLRIGLSLPGDVEVETFPSEVTSRVSRLDQCRYVVVDDRIAVVDPDGDKIVAIIE